MSGISYDFFVLFLPDHLKFVKDSNDFCRYTAAKMIQNQLIWAYLESKCPACWFIALAQVMCFEIQI